MSKLTINIAKDAGFCMGVRRAIEIAKKAAQQYGRVAMLGDIVHNEGVVRELEQAGIVVYDDLDQIPPEMPVIFRSHGTRADIRQRAQARGMTIIDATCPLVKEIHRAARELAVEGRRVIIIGDHGHDEVEAIAGEIADPLIIADESETVAIPKIGQAGVVIQSTQFRENVDAILAKLIWKISDVRIINTICKPTRNRQVQIRELARENDVMLIVGSFTSANTKRLTGIAKKINPKSYQIRGPEDIQTEWLRGAASVGISAGASTPDKIVRDVADKIGALGL
ncbi:MAG: 4-hydroxy-3-methylbut-2-enyl diphosphate reductase [Fidelibacterota bacterium]